MKGSGYLLLVIIMLSIFLIVKPPIKQTYSEEYSGFGDEYLNTIIGENTTGWYYYKLGDRRSIIGITHYNPDEKILIHLFDYYTPDEFTYKPTAIEDRPTKIFVSLHSKADEKHNYILIGDPISVYLIGPEKYGGLGQYMLVYTYKRMELDKAELTLRNGTTITTQSYNKIRNLYKDRLIKDVKVYTTLYPARMNVILVGDKRYNNWGEPEVKCTNIISCQDKVYTTHIFSPLYQISELPRNLDDVDIPDYGLILTPFYNVTTWTYNPEYQYFVGSGTGIAWNATCGHPPFIKYNLRWMGPGDINEFYSITITGNPDENCCHLPAYYINFLPLWCKAGKEYGELFYNITKVSDRIRDIPLGNISGYIPGTGVNYVYTNGKLYMFKQTKPPVTNIHYSTNPLVIYFNTTVRFNFEEPSLTPIHEIGIVPLELGKISKLWFTNPTTIVTLDAPMKTITIIKLETPITPHRPIEISSKETHALNGEATVTYYNNGTIYVVTKKGTLYEITGNEVIKKGTILEGVKDISVQNNKLVTLYQNRLVIYNISKSPKVTKEVELNDNYKWVVTSKQLLFLIGNKKVSVYGELPEQIVEEKGGNSTLTLSKNLQETGTSQTVINNHKTSSITSKPTINNKNENKSPSNEDVETRVTGNGLRISITVILILVVLVAYIMMKIK